MTGNEIHPLIVRTVSSPGRHVVLIDVRSHQIVREFGSGVPEQEAFDVALALKKLVPGVQFSTRFEQGCTVATVPDELGNFEGYDSDNVRCQFSLAMVEAIEFSPDHLYEVKG